MKTIQKISLIAVLFIQFCSSSTGGGSAQNDFIDVTGPTELTKNLGVEGTATVTIESKDFAGNVQLEIDRTQLDAEYQADTDIVLSLSTSEITLTANQTQTVTINYEIKGTAPSFKSTKNDEKGEFVLVATIPSEDEILKVDVPFQVNPIYEIHLSIDDMTGDHSFDAPDPLNFRAHEEDLVLRFINMDPLAAHGIHANGGVEHQSGTMTAAPSAGEEGGVYEVIVDQSGGNSTYYCHTHQMMGDPTWQMTFNN